MESVKSQNRVLNTLFVFSIPVFILACIANHFIFLPVDNSAPFPLVPFQKAALVAFPIIAIDDNLGPYPDPDPPECGQQWRWEQQKEHNESYIRKRGSVILVLVVLLLFWSCLCWGKHVVQQEQFRIEDQQIEAEWPLSNDHECPWDSVTTAA
jgi:hypothetical protein